MFVAHVDMGDIVSRLGRASAVLGDLGPEMDVAAQDLVTEVTDRYDSEGDGQWPALASATVKKRRKGSSKPMQDTGRAKGSTRAQSSATEAVALSDVEYLVYHLEGGAVIPKRNPFEVKQENLDRIIDDIVDGATKRLEAAL